MAELAAAVEEEAAVSDRRRAAARAAFTWRTVDAELAELLHDSALDAGAAVRSGSDGPRMLSFRRAAVTLEVEIDGDAVLGEVIDEYEGDAAPRHRDAAAPRRRGPHRRGGRLGLLPVRRGRAGLGAVRGRAGRVVADHALGDDLTSSGQRGPMILRPPALASWLTGAAATRASYAVGTTFTHYNVFDIKPNDVYWCTADIGWVTGHSYIVYGPLINGTTTVMFEGVPKYPDKDRFWDIVEKYKVTIL